MPKERCGRCHRVLKSPECIGAGFGRECYKKVFGKTLSVRAPTSQRRSYAPHVHTKARKNKDNNQMPPLFVGQLFEEGEDDELKSDD